MRNKGNKISKYQIHAYTINIMNKLFKHERSSSGKFSDENISMEFKITIDETKSIYNKVVEVKYWDRETKNSLEMTITKTYGGIYNIQAFVKRDKEVYTFSSAYTTGLEKFDADLYYNILRDMKPYITIVSLTATKLNTINLKKEFEKSNLFNIK